MEHHVQQLLTDWQGPLSSGEVSVERVPVDVPVGTVRADAHWEGDTLVVPVLEEVVVVERRWIVREEVRITPRRPPAPPS